MNCPNCQYENPDEAKFCQNCGQALARICPHCGTWNAPAAKFCMNCGEGFIPHPSPPAPPLPSRQKRGKRGQSGEAQPGESSEVASLADLRRSAPQALQDRIRLAAAQIEGERKPVTILFTDIVGSTSLAEKMDPEEWREVVNGAHRRVSQAVHRYEGTIAQLLGDGVLAFFGAPLTHEDDPQRALRAALDIQMSIGEYAREQVSYLESFQMRIGINTGTVVVGAVGDDLHMEYLAIGDSVNLAARLQSAAEPGKILISESTARLVRAEFDLEDLSERSFKGKERSVRVYEVSGLKGAPERGRGIEGLISPLVGRDGELKVVRQRLEELREGRGGIVLILGEAGIGKSRLVDEARRLIMGSSQWLADSQGEKSADLLPDADSFETQAGEFNQVSGAEKSRGQDSHPSPSAELTIHWLEGRSLSYGSGLSYWAVTELIMEDLGLSIGDPEPRIRVALRRRVDQLFGEKSNDHLLYLEHLIGVQTEGEAALTLGSLDAETLKHETLAAISAYFRSLAAEKPTVLVFEDLHWADGSTINALENLLGETDRVPLLVLGLMRVDRDHRSWGLKLKVETDFGHRYSEISLEALSEETANQLVDNLLSLADLPEKVRALLLERSDGNPFYLEEVIRSLIENGALVQSEGRWQAGREIQEMDIPETLQGVLLARIDRLEEDLRYTLQIASVIGRSFQYRLLEAIDEAERELEGHLAWLQRLDLVREKQRFPELEYIFKHSLTQEAAYNSLLLERRREFHRKVAGALETIFADRRDEYLGLLAYHFDRGGKTEKATTYLLKAGDQARLEDAQQEAAQFYERAAELLLESGQDELAAQTYLKLGMVYHIDFRFADAHRANEAAFRLQQIQRDRVSPSNEEKNGLNEEMSFRGGLGGLVMTTLDPGNLTHSDEGIIASDLFAGIAELNPDMNMLPRGASSWEVFDGGLRYLIHLREDVVWTDGNPVTAVDYDFAWKRNLRLSERDYPASLLDDIKGARDYRLGKNEDPLSVGVRAIDDWTLEVSLEKAVAYFPYILTLPITYPQPGAVVERYGNDWWRPEYLVCNGPFRLSNIEEVDNRVAYERNPDYFGATRGNLTRVEWRDIPDLSEREALFRAGDLDYAEFPRHKITSKDMLSLEIPSPGEISSTFMVFAPVYPMDDLRIRKALIHALDMNSSLKPLNLKAAHGGLVPPNMAGHSPGICLPYDLDLARRLLEDAGYPEGKGFPFISGRSFTNFDTGEKISALWRDNLGIQIEFVVDLSAQWDPSVDKVHLGGWQADYPDPDNFLRQSTILDFLRSHGWRDPDYEDLVNRAAETPNRTERMAMYRKADLYLVADQALVMPLIYGHGQVEVYLKQPWVQDMGFSSLSFLGARFITVDPHMKPRA